MIAAQLKSNYSKPELFDYFIPLEKTSSPTKVDTVTSTAKINMMRVLQRVHFVFTLLQFRS
jgi:hypothetical protein